MNRKVSVVDTVYEYGFAILGFIVGLIVYLIVGCLLCFGFLFAVYSGINYLADSQPAVADSTNSAYNFSRALTLEDAWKASCRVSVSGARGTGTFVGIDEEKNVAVILTNYHVVTRSTEATLDFWTNGVQESVQGKIYARFYDKNRPADFALIAVNPRDLARINPPYVALAGADGAPSENSYIISAGCPKGRFVQAWKGKTLGYYRGRTIEFKPGPVPGQSGSGVLSYVDGELWLTAVLTWLIGNEGADDSTGGAIPISNLYDCLSGQSPASDYFESPIPPGAKECSESVLTRPQGGALEVDTVIRGAAPLDYNALAPENNKRPAGADTRLRAEARDKTAFGGAPQEDNALALENGERPTGAETTPAARERESGFNDRASAPCVLEFTQADCPPCEDAKRDVEELRALGVTVYSYDVATERGSEYVARYGVSETPTFVILDSAFKPVETIKGAGKTSAIFDAYRAACDVARDSLDSTSEQRERRHASSVPDKSAFGVSIVNLPELAPNVSVEEDFRNRPAVYEIVSDVGFFEDSDARWQELKKRKKWTRPNEDENGGAEEEPSDGDEETTPEKKRPRIGERLTDGAVDVIVGKVEGKINEKVESMKDDLREKWEAVKFTALMTLCFTLAVALLVAEGIVGLVKFCWRKVCTKAREIVETLKTEDPK